MTGRFWSAALFGVLATIAAPAEAAVLTSDLLTVTIREDNGTIDSAVFRGIDYFSHGTPISDYGFQNGTDTTTFTWNKTTGATGQSVAVSGTRVAGIFTAGGANVAFTRRYSLIDDVDVLRVTTDFVNQGDELVLAYFDVIDPDQGWSIGRGYNTCNEVVSLAEGRIGQAHLNPAWGATQTVLVGSTDARASVASGYSISDGISGSRLNDFFKAPADSQGGFFDALVYIGLRVALAPGESTSFTYDMAFGSNPTQAQAAFQQANPAMMTPEPLSIAAWGGLAGLGLVVGALRRRRK